MTFQHSADHYTHRIATGLVYCGVLPFKYDVSTLGGNLNCATKIINLFCANVMLHETQHNIYNVQFMEGGLFMCT